MAVIKDFSNKTLNQIKWWAWAAAVLPITALAGIFFVWLFGTKELLDIVITLCATVMFSTTAIWWWWILWTVSRIMQKERRIDEELKNAITKIQNIKIIVRETFDKTNK